MQVLPLSHTPSLGLSVVLRCAHLRIHLYIEENLSWQKCTTECVCLHMCMHTCVHVKAKSWVVFLRNHPPCFLRLSHWPGTNKPMKLGWLASVPQVSSFCLCRQNLDFFMWILGTEQGSSCFYSKYFTTNWAISPDQTNPFRSTLEVLLYLRETYLCKT